MKTRKFRSCKRQEKVCDLFLIYDVECNFNDRESIDSYVSKVDKVAQKLIKARKFDAAMHLLTQV